MPILAEFWPIHGPCYLDTAELYQQSSDGYISGLGRIEKIIVSPGRELSNLIPLVKPNIRLGGTPKMKLRNFQECFRRRFDSL